MRLPIVSWPRRQRSIVAATVAVVVVSVATAAGVSHGFGRVTPGPLAGVGRMFVDDRAAPGEVHFWSGRSLARSVPADADGRFVIPPLPNGRYHLVATAPGFLSRPVRLDLPRDPTRPVELFAYGCRGVSATVIDARTEQPVPGASIVVGGAWRTISDTSGHVTTCAAHDGSGVWVKAHGYHPSTGEWVDDDLRELSIWPLSLTGEIDWDRRHPRGRPFQLLLSGRWPRAVAVEWLGPGCVIPRSCGGRLAEGIELFTDCPGDLAPGPLVMVRVRGRVSYQHRPVADAKVRLYGNRFAAGTIGHTDRDGHFDLFVEPTGPDVAIQVEHHGRGLRFFGDLPRDGTELAIELLPND